MSSWLTADQAAERLGVKPATLYAYVSRGVLTRHRAGDGRSHYDPAEIEQLARRGRPRRPVDAGPELVVRSAITRLGADRPFYRGHDALELAGSHELEDVASLLWTDRLEAPAQPWRPPPDALVAARTAQSGLPPEVLGLERLQVVTPVLAAYDPFRLTTDPAAVVHIGRSLIAGLVESLPARQPADDEADHVTDRLWPRLTARPVDPALRDVLRAALVLLADHELAASTLAARMAAAVRAGPYAVVLTGLGTMGGTLHSGASLAAEELLAEVDEPGQVPAALGRRLRRGERINGFGHQVYRHGDGRAAALLDRLRLAAPGHPMLAVADVIVAELRDRLGLGMNIDFALAVFGRIAGLAPGSGEAIFAVARTAGWLAHAIEEYTAPTRLRPRATYTGRT
jgi:citrate synthase